MVMHGGKLAARALKEAGVEVIFTLSGGHVMAIYDGCIDEGIEVGDEVCEVIVATRSNVSRLPEAPLIGCQPSTSLSGHHLRERDAVVQPAVQTNVGRSLNRCAEFANEKLQSSNLQCPVFHGH